MITKTKDREDTSIGGVTWHCSEKDGGPDVGISVYLGPNDHLWCGEMASTLWEECGGKDHFDSDGGWFIVRYSPEGTKLIAKCGDPDEAREFVEWIASLLRQLPEEMKHCTIQFKECEKGHGRLTATNWIDHGCRQCKIEELTTALSDMLAWADKPAEQASPSWIIGACARARKLLAQCSTSTKGATNDND
jgi:hypothetical protein